MLQILRPDLRPLVSMFLAGSFVAVASRPAAAGGPTTPRPPVDLGDATIESRLKLPDGDGGFEAQSPEENWLFMNLAACTCGNVEEATFAAEFDLQGTPSPDELDAEVRIWAGVSCDSSDRETRDNQCVEPVDRTVNQLRDLDNAPDVPVTVRELVGPRAGACTQADERTRTVFAIFDEDDNGVNADEGDLAIKLDILADTRPPPVPVRAEAVGSEEAVRVTWELPDSRRDDAWYFQVLCARADGTTDSSDDFPRAEKLYRTTRDICGIDDPSVCPRPLSDLGSEPDDPDAGVSIDAGAEAQALGGPDAAPDGGSEDEDAGSSGSCPDLPNELEILDGAFICGEASQGASEIRVEGLENSVRYHVVLVIADKAGNPVAIDLGETTPLPVTDFWEHYQNAGGQAKGCSAAQAGLGGGLILVFAVIIGFGVPAALRRRRRGKSSIAGGTALLLVLGLSATASAQPWWEGYDDEPTAEELAPPVPHWSFEIKVGPYYPDVDSEFSGDTHPFEDMFGDGPFVLTGFTLDRYLLYPLGQLGLTFSAGFLGWSANAFREAAEGDDPDAPPERAIGDKTAFRLIPTSLGVVYRFTALDDQFRVPLVPYGRAGLSYYYWWTTKPNGSVSEAAGEKGRGGSLGWQATIGLAVRVERIDPEAEVSLRTELGIEHAGLIFEYTYAKVDGFGAGDKLAVGDATWFGGINFEF